jgi:hypothetical protein
MRTGFPHGDYFFYKKKLAKVLLPCHNSSVSDAYDREGGLCFSSRTAEGKADFIFLMELAWAIKDVVEVKVIFITNPIE